MIVSLKLFLIHCTYQSHYYLHFSTVVEIGLQQNFYEVSENAGSVPVCIQLLKGSTCYRPANARLYTNDGSAIGKQ